MAVLPEIPYIDMRGGTPIDLLKLYPDRARALVTSTTNMYGLASRVVGMAALPLGDRASRNWLRRTGNPFLGEIDQIAALMQIRGVHFETNIGGPRWRARALGADDFAQDFAWFKPPLANVNSRLAFQADAATGRMALIGTAGSEPATRAFRVGEQ